MQQNMFILPVKGKLTVPQNLILEIVEDQVAIWDSQLSFDQ